LNREKAHCKVYNVTEEIARILSLAENIHRKDYARRELADIYDRLVKECGGDIEEAATLISKKPVEVRRVLATLSLGEEIIEQTKGIQDKRTRDAVEEYLPLLAKDDRKKAAIQIIKDRNAD
jgi:ParB/RepB/Spo0J family partition protein